MTTGSPRYEKYVKLTINDFKTEVANLKRTIMTCSNIKSKIERVGFVSVKLGGLESIDFTRKYATTLFENAVAQISNLTDTAKSLKSTRSGTSRINNGFKNPMYVSKMIQYMFVEAHIAGRLGWTFFDNEGNNPQGTSSLGAMINFCNPTQPPITSSAQITSLFALYMLLARLNENATPNRDDEGNVSVTKRDHYGQDGLMARYLGDVYMKVRGSFADKFEEDTREYDLRVEDYQKDRSYNGLKLRSPKGIKAMAAFAKRMGRQDDYIAFMQAAGKKNVKWTGRGVDTNPGVFDKWDFRFSSFQSLSSKVRVADKDIPREDYHMVKAGEYFGKTLWSSILRTMKPIVDGELNRIKELHAISDPKMLLGNRRFRGNNAAEMTKPDSKIIDDQALFAEIKEAIAGNPDYIKYVQSLPTVTQEQRRAKEEALEKLEQAWYTRLALNVQQYYLSRTLEVSRLYKKLKAPVESIVYLATEGLVEYITNVYLANNQQVVEKLAEIAELPDDVLFTDEREQGNEDMLDYLVTEYKVTMGLA